MAFYTEGSPLFKEWLDLTANRLSPSALDPLGAEDALVIIESWCRVQTKALGDNEVQSFFVTVCFYVFFNKYF